MQYYQTPTLQPLWPNNLQMMPVPMLGNGSIALAPPVPPALPVEPAGLGVGSSIVIGVIVILGSIAITLLSWWLFFWVGKKVMFG